MNALWGALATAVFGALGVLGAAKITQSANARAEQMRNALENRKVDQTEFDAITRELRASLADDNTQLREERAARKEAERRILQLEQALRAASLPVPD